MNPPAVLIRDLNHAFAEGELRRQVLFDINVEIEPGEIVILTGPSGSGKTTLLTLIGALRSAQEGSLQVLGEELRGANEQVLAAARKRIGYIFQAHNLLDSLTARQNVQMSLQLQGDFTSDVERRVTEILERVGLGDRIDHYPHQLSTGQRQRVAIARALVAHPQLVLADEPTASLDKESGRAVVEIIRTLSKQERVPVVLVTHDNRILDIADRILALEDGRLSSLMSAVTASTERLTASLARELRRGELAQRITRMSGTELDAMLREVTGEMEGLLQVIDVTQSATFESMITQVLQAFAAKTAEGLRADRSAIFLVDPARDEIWSLDQCGHGQSHEIRAPLGKGIAGTIAQSGAPMNVPNALEESAFDAEVDGTLHGTTASVIGVPIVDSRGRVFAVAEVVREHGPPFDQRELERLRQTAASLAVILEAWWRMSCKCRTTSLGIIPACCRSEPGFTGA